MKIQHYIKYNIMNKLNESEISISKKEYIEPNIEVINLTNTPILADSTRSCSHYGCVCYEYGDY